MKSCNFCRNMNFIEKKVDYFYRKNGKYLVVNHVPCEECEYCGERYFKGEELKKIEKEFNDIYTYYKKPQKEIKVPVEEYTYIT